jgi:hypothetical protein
MTWVVMFLAITLGLPMWAVGATTVRHPPATSIFPAWEREGAIDTAVREIPTYSG